MTQVFVEPSHDLPLVSASVALRSGSVHDPPGKEGLTRLTARMLRRGAKDLPARAIEERIDSLGGEFGADASISATAASFEVIRRSLDPFASLVAHLLAEPTFDAGELDKLKRQVQADLVESRDSDGLLVGRAFRRTLFAGHPYARRLSGTMESIATITRDDVVAHYRRHFVQENAVVAISGDVTSAEADELAARLLAGLPAGAAVADPTPPTTWPAGRELVVVDKPDRTQTQMVVGTLGTHASDPDHTALLVANTAFGGTFSSRLMQEIRAKRGWSYGAYARAGVDRQREAFSMSMAPAATDAAPCLGLALELLRGLLAEGLRQEEIDFVKSYLVKSHAFEVDTAKKRVAQKLDAALYDYPPGYHEGYLDRVAAVTLDQANAALRNRIQDDKLVVAVVATDAAIGDALAAAVPNLAKKTVLPHDFE